MAADGSVEIEIKGDDSDVSQALERTRQKAEEVSKSVENIGKSSEKSTEQIADSAEATKKSTEQIAEDLKQVSSEASSAGQGAQKVAKELKSASSEASLTAEETQNLSEELQNAQGATEDINQRTEELADNVENVGKQSEESGKKATEATESSKKGIIAANSAIAAATVALTALGTTAVKAGMEFDSAMSQVAATMGLSVDEIQAGNESFELLSQAARDAGATTAFSATEAAQALNYLALAGYDAATAAEVLPSVLNLAAAGGMDLAYASDLATDAMSALGIEASNENLTQFGDQLAVTASKANTSVAQLGEAILTVGATARSLSGGTVELNSALGILADAGIKGAEGGTKLRNAILSLSAPTDAAKKQLNALGVSVFDSNGQMRALQEIFGDLNAAMADFTDEQKVNAVAEIFNSRDIGAVNYLLEVSSDRWNELGASIAASTGAMQDMADVQLDNLAGDLTILQSASEGAMISLSDSLEPALRRVVQALTSVVTVVGDALEKVPLLGSVLAGLAAAGVTLGAGVAAGAVASALGITAATTATGGLTAAVAALTAALAANPFGLLAAGIGGAVALFAAFSQGAKEGKDANEEFLESIKETQETLSENVKSQEENTQNLQAQADAILKLAEAGELNGIQLKAMLEMIDQLNQSVPGLNLAYDAQTGSLNMTADAMQNYIDKAGQQATLNEAAQTYSQLLAQEAEISNQLEAAKVRLAEAQARENAAKEAGLGTSTEWTQNRIDEAVACNDLEVQLAALRDAIGELEEEYGDSLSEAGNFSNSLGEVSQSAEGTEDQIEALVEKMDALEEATTAVTAASDLYKTALSEQSSEGSIALDTALELIDAGYGAALAIDEETGAVTLNKDAYINLATAKIQAQIATLEVERASLDAVSTLSKEEAAAKTNASAYWQMAAAKAAANADDLKSLDVQIAALKQAQASLTSYSGAVTTAARASSSASKKIQTQAEKDLAEYKSLKAELDHQKNMDLVDEADYYKQLEGLRDKYLTDAANIEEYRKVSETIHKADQQILEDEKEALDKRKEQWKTAGQNIIDLETEFQQQLADRASAISHTYDLFEEVPEKQKVSGQELMQNLQDQITSIESFYANLDALGDRDVSLADGLLEEIREMGPSAAGELEALLSMTDEKLQEYSDLYASKQALSVDIATAEMSDARAALDEKVLQELISAAGELPDEMEPIGADAIQALADGMAEKGAEAVAVAEDIADDIAAQLSRISGLSEQLKAAVEAESARLTAQLTISSNAPAEARAARDRTNAAQNAAASAAFRDDRSRDVFTLNVGGKEFWRGQLEDLRTVEDETPRTLDDT